MSDRLNHLLETARRWADAVEDMPALTPEDEDLLQAINDYEGEEG